jgi:toxin ParE1/3/4
MTFEVRFTRQARKDLREIHNFIAENGSPEKATAVVRGILRTALGLEEMPERGNYATELLAFGEKAYRQVHFKAYRILYRIRGKTVFVGLIADGRRNLAPLLARRLLSASPH